MIEHNKQVSVALECGDGVALGIEPAPVPREECHQPANAFGVTKQASKGMSGNEFRIF